MVLCFGPQVRDKASSLRPLLCAQGPSRCGHPAAFFSASGLARVVSCVCVWLSVSAIRPALFCSAESAESAQLCSAWLCMALQFCTPIVCTTTGYPNIPWLMLDHSGPLLPVPTSYLGTMDMYTVSSFLLRSARHLHRCTHARTHARTYRLHLHPSPALPATRAACRRAVGGRPVVRLSVSCAVCAALLLCGSCSPSCQCLPVASQCLACLSVCLSACLSACPPGQSPPKNHHLPPSRHIV